MASKDLGALRTIGVWLGTNEREMLHERGVG